MQNYFSAQETPILAADFDYFRIKRAKWELMLTRLKQMGVNALSLSIPWGFHELGQGIIDLNGTSNPRRNLSDLIKLCPTVDLYCVLKPGPYSHKGILADGLPLWLKNSSDFETAFTPAVERWYIALTKALLNQQWPDGPIVALYIHSESSEYQAPIDNKQLVEVKWRIWLRKQYSSIEDLNAAYQTDYRTVNDVKFPATWANGETLVEKDAKQFLEKVQSDAETHYAQFLVEAGWQIPIYPSALDIYADLPPIQSVSLISPNLSTHLTAIQTETFVDLQEAVEVEPDPPDLGLGPAWADKAPIRVDASLRYMFWNVRWNLWQRHLPQATLSDDELFMATFEGGGLMTGRHNAPVKIKVDTGTKPPAFRLRLNGELVPDANFSVSRRQLTGTYVAVDEIRQTDMVLFLNNPDVPLEGFALSYLRNLLAMQTQALNRCVYLATTLGDSLTLSPEPATPAPQESEPQVSRGYTLEEARRGLSEADAALRKAVASISGLESGVNVILGKSGAENIPQPPVAPPPISPEIFQGSARAILVETGRVCADIAPALDTAARQIQAIVAAPSFTVRQYQQGYQTAIEVAQTSRQPLLAVIAQLRLEIASERLPLLTWRIHDQIQEIAESLRWGVLRS